MYRDGKQFLTADTMNFVLNNGALGDVITSLPAIIAAREGYHPALKMKVWAPSWQNDLVRHLLAPYGEFEVVPFEDFPMTRALRGDWKGGHTALNQIPYNTHTRNRVHMVDYAFACLTDSRPESWDERNYPTLAPLGQPVFPSPYVVFPVGAGSDNRLFRASVMAPIMRWCQDESYKVVVVGTKASHTKLNVGGKLTPIVLREESSLLPTDILAQCVDMREKTTLLELRDLCGYAAAVVGVDGGTLHLAGTTDAPIVYGLTTTVPKHRSIVRQGDPSHRIRYVGPRDLECAGCQSNWRMSRQDFTQCAYGDNLCTERLHPDDFIEALKQLGL